MSNKPEGRMCPHCNVWNRAITSACEACRKLFPAGSIQRVAQEGEVDAMRAKLLELDGRAEDPADTSDQPGKFSLGFFIVSGLVAASLSATFMESIIGNGAAAIAVALFIVLLLVWIVMFVNALTLPSARDRRTSHAAVKCFFTALRRGRFDVAHACISHAGRRTVPFPPTQELIERHGDADLATKAGVKSYWRDLCRGSGSRIRMMGAPVIVPVGEDKLHRYAVTLRITHYSTLVYLGLLAGIVPAVILQLATQKKFMITFAVTAHRTRSQWWVVSGELNSPVDSELDLSLATD